MNLGRFGFSVDVNRWDEAAEIEQLGFGTVWIRGGQLDRLDRLTDLLGATRTAIVGSSIISPSVHDAAAVARLYETAEYEAPGRLLVGLGSPQKKDALTSLGGYLDALDSVPHDRRLLAAFGPRALGIARDRFAGAMPMLFTPEHTAVARQVLGADRVLSVGLYAVIEDNAAKARTEARTPLGFLTTLPGYKKSFARQGFSDRDVAEMGDHLVDSLVAWGGPRDIVERAGRLHAAGADHVHLTVLGDAGQPTGVTAARLLAEAIT